MHKKAQGFSYQTNQPIGQSKDQWTTDLDCDRCPHHGPFVLIKKREGQEAIEVMCPECNKIKNVKAIMDRRQGGFEMENNKIKVSDEPVGAPIFQSNKVARFTAQKRDLDGVPTKDSFNGARVENSFEEVNPQGKKTIGPFTKEREEYKEKTKPFQATSQVLKSKKVQELTQTASTVKTASDLSNLDFEKLASPNRAITESVKKELAKSAAMYPQVSVLPANGLAQWCPKLRNTVSMDICATKCIDGRRIPQTEGFETYQDYLIQGGDANGKVHCGYKDWLKREVDAFYPGWVEDHIKKMGGEVVGSETNFGNRRMNLDEGERRHLPRYPEEKLVEKQLEERHRYVPESKTASKKEENNCKCTKDSCKCKKK